jgi:hypothetical protein
MAFDMLNDNDEAAAKTVAKTARAVEHQSRKVAVRTNKVRGHCRWTHRPVIINSIATANVHAPLNPI